MSQTRSTLNLFDFPSKHGVFLESYLVEMLLSQEKGLAPAPRATLFELDDARSLVGLLCISYSEETFYAFFVSGKKELTPVYQKKIRWETPYIDIPLYLNIVWLKREQRMAPLGIKSQGRSILFYMDNAPLLALKNRHLTKKNSPELPLFNRLLHALCNIRFIRNKYAGCWLFMDRDYKADDNAEHLYRWVLRNRPEVKALFVLRKDSPDWKRLKNEGFKLLPYSFFRYFAAYMHCSWLISSNLTEHITKPNWKGLYAGTVKRQFCFLQHGITKDYQPTLNRIYSNIILTAAHEEYASFATDPRYPYLFCEKEIQLTGFPRHDALQEKATRVSSPQTLLIMPTWRQNLVGPMISGTSTFAYSSRFKDSSFFKHWQDVLLSKTLRTLAEKRSLRISFYPHPYIRQQMQDFHLPDHITALDDAVCSIQDTLADTALLITDYSSIAFDAALIKRPIIYYQFDKNNFFSGDHAYMNGYFDYDKNGFGPVSQNFVDLEAALNDFMDTDGSMLPLYRKRCDAFFAYADTDNCRRVYEALVHCSTP